MMDFSSLGLKPELLTNLESLAYHQMTPIQAQSLPEILAGKDVIAQGKTGSGKTAAFGLGLLQHVEVKRFRVQALVLCPTRELADQVSKEIRRLARTTHNIKVLTLCGGMPFGPQIGSLEHGAHFVIGTPGRIDEHIRKGTLQLDALKILVLDEADRMLEMGFQETLDNIISKTPEQRQTLLFSATFPDNIQAIAKRVMRSPVTIQVESTHEDSVIEQSFFKVTDKDSRSLAVKLLIQQQQAISTLVFCNTKREVQELADSLNQQGFTVLALHGDLEQRDRDSALIRFSNNSVNILVATDVAARGLDIDTIELVINYQLARNNEVHIHRIGRTGRAGNKGLACTLFNSKEEYKVATLESYLQKMFNIKPLPPIELLKQTIQTAPMVTLQIDGGKKQKVRPGDLLGALTSNSDRSGIEAVAGKCVGKINVFDNWTFIAVQQQVAKQALKKLTMGKIKGRSFRARILYQT